MASKRPFLPFHQPSIGEDEISEVVATLKSGWLTTGPRTAQFEKEFRDYVRAPHALAVNSCTAGLHLALAALGIAPGDEVITTPMTFCATVNVILHVGATPVLADIGSDGNIDPASVAERITPRTRAIVPVHYAGLPCRMDDLWELARRHGLYVIEDAAHATGTHYKGAPIGAANPASGSRSDAVAFSFYATKALTTGEGGMVVTHDATLRERMQVLCLHGISKDAWNRYTAEGSWYYQVLNAGFKYNLSDLQSAVGIPQLRRQEEFLARRAHLACLYDELLADCEHLQTPADTAEGRHAWHLYVIQLNLAESALTRNEVIASLHQAGIGTSVHFIPIPLHPAYQALAALPENRCPKALEMYSRAISLPLYPAMTEDDVRFVAGSLRAILARAGKRHASTGAA